MDMIIEGYDLKFHSLFGTRVLDSARVLQWDCQRKNPRGNNSYICAVKNFEVDKELDDEGREINIINKFKFSKLVSGVHSVSPNVKHVNGKNKGRCTWGANVVWVVVRRKKINDYESVCRLDYFPFNDKLEFFDLEKKYFGKSFSNLVSGV